jgi:hypothetical protein
MKIFLLIITITLFFNIHDVVGQSIQGDQFLRDIFKEKLEENRQFVYTKGIRSNSLNDMIQVIQDNNSFFTYERIGNKLKAIDSLVLIYDEKQFIVNNLEKQIDTSLWSNFDIPYSLAMTQDSITTIFTDDNLGWTYFLKEYRSCINSFSVPIFFRNNQLCVFYFEQICGDLNGGGEFAIYRRENGYWVKWLTLFEWVS